MSDATDATGTTAGGSPNASELLAATMAADRTVGVTVAIRNVRPEFVVARPTRGFPDRVNLYLAGFGGQVSIDDDIATLRAVVQEADRQLARLEVETRVRCAVAHGAKGKG